MLTVSLSTKSKKSSSTADSATVTGRFAPSPTGPLHLGSLLAATASYLDARARRGRWLVRIDDLDKPRNQAGADTLILKSLEAHALHWDGEVSFQSLRQNRYLSALDRLAEHVFYCRCSRRQLRGIAVYPGTCRQQRKPRSDSAIRVEVPDRNIEFTDLIMGSQCENLAASVGDFIIRRRDGLIAYQLATAVDDGDPSITHVVRGRDLLDNTVRQIFLMQLLELKPPSYAHVPLLTYPGGEKLSKQHGAAAVDDSQAVQNLITIFAALGMTVPAEVAALPTAEVVSWGIEHWQPARVPHGNSIVPR